MEPIGFTAEEIAAAKKRAKDSSRSWYTGAEVAAHLAALEKAVEAEGAVDKDRLREVLIEARQQSQK